MKKSLLVMLILVGVVTTVMAFQQYPDKYENLKVLPKDTNKYQMDSIMDNYCAALNVKCNFCHVKSDDGKDLNFASDDNKHKRIAREMFTMTAKLNNDYFSDETNAVTCYTCHQGKKHPATFAPAVAPAPKLWGSK